MSLLAYTSCNDVRALLGVENDEITDETLTLEVYSSNLSSELDSIDVQLASKYQDVKLITASSRTAAETRFFNTCRLFAAYAVAKQACTSLPMFGPKEISDIKTTVARFSDSPYKETIKAVKANFDVYRTRLVEAYNAVATQGITLVTRKYMLVSQPSTDPVVE